MPTPALHLLSAESLGRQPEDPFLLRAGDTWVSTPSTQTGAGRGEGRGAGRECHHCQCQGDKPQALPGHLPWPLRQKRFVCILLYLLIGSCSLFQPTQTKRSEFNVLRSSCQRQTTPPPMGKQTPQHSVLLKRQGGLGVCWWGGFYPKCLTLLSLCV